MDEEKQPRMTILDQMLAEDHLQMMKAAIPYLPFGAQKMVALYAKVVELQHTVSLFSSEPELSAMANHPEASCSISDMLEDMSQYIDGSSKEQLENIISAFSALSMFQSLQEMNDQN